MSDQKPPIVSRGVAAAEISDIVHREVADMIRLTCIVNLRRECFDCIHKRVTDQFIAFVSGDEMVELLNEEFEQFVRQVVVWAKEQAEGELAKECTMGENAKELIANIVMQELER
jgi:hypothetical protein